VFLEVYTEESAIQIAKTDKHKNTNTYNASNKKPNSTIVQFLPKRIKISIYLNMK
jgi:hypothetical protein